MNVGVLAENRREIYPVEIDSTKDSKLVIRALLLLQRSNVFKKPTVNLIARSY
jgi:hypothetical protein